MWTSNHLKYYENLIKQKEVRVIDKKIVESLAWKKRALESTNYNEAILWHWISIENLFSSKNETTKLIFHFAPKILVNTYIYHFIQQIRHWICCKTFPFSNYNISKDAIKFIQNIQKNITYKEFIEITKNFCKYLDEQSFFYEKIQDFIKIFNDEKQFKIFIENYKKQIEQKLIFLYRIRNKIAHNANNEHNATIIYYRNFASYINTALVCYFIDKRLEGLKTNEEIIHYGEYEYDKMLLNLKKHGVDSIINPKDYE